MIAAIESRVPLLVEARDIVARFQGMIRKRSLGDLETCQERARSSLVASFASGIVKNRAPVSAALASPWSNGQADGQILRLKRVKRPMYGRGKLDLLQAGVRRRVNHADKRAMSDLLIVYYRSRQ